MERNSSHIVLGESSETMWKLFLSTKFLHQGIRGNYGIFVVCDKDLRSLINRLDHDSFLAIVCFQNIYMKLNEDKCHLLVGGYKHESIWAKIGDARIWESNKQKLLGVHIDRTLSFDEQVSNL